MRLYPLFVGVACGVPLGGELGYEDPPQADNSKSMLSSSKHIVAKRVCENWFFCIVVPSLLWREKWCFSPQCVHKTQQFMKTIYKKNTSVPLEEPYIYTLVGYTPHLLWTQITDREVKMTPS